MIFLQLLNTIDNLTKVSDALCGVVQSSEEQLNHPPVSHDLTSREEEDLFRSIVTCTPSDGVESPGKGVSGEEREEEDDEELRMLLRGGDTTVSSLVLHKGEKWSKENLRKWMSQRKKTKLTEFAEMRESRSSTGTRSLKASPAVDGLSSCGPGDVKVREAF